MSAAENGGRGIFPARPIDRAGPVRHDAAVPEGPSRELRHRLVSRAWFPSLLVIGVALGVVLGLAGYTFVYAEGVSYLTDRAEACANCHVMRAHYDAWIKSSHRAAAVCNDCHTPSGVWPKWKTKLRSGWSHAVAFTTGNVPDPIRITPAGRAVVVEACRGCHDDMVHAMLATGGPDEATSCIRCHPDVGHME